MTTTMTRDRSRARRRMLMRREAGIAVALIVLIVVFTALEPARFATERNLLNILTDSATLVVLAMATTFVIISRNLDLSIGGVIAFCEVLSAKTMSADGGMADALWGLAVAVAAGLGWGALNGFLVSRARVPSFVATLAVLGMSQGAAYVISGGVDIGSVPTALAERVGIGRLLGVSVLTWLAAVVFLVSVWTLRRTMFGRHTYAIGSDPLAAGRAGINVPVHTMKIYLLAGALYGLVAWLNLSRFSTTNVGGHANDALNAITAVVLGGASMFGGVGTAAGTLIGVFIPAVIQNGLVINSVQPFWQLIAVGAALAVAVSLDSFRRRNRVRN